MDFSIYLGLVWCLKHLIIPIDNNVTIMCLTTKKPVNWYSLSNFKSKTVLDMLWKWEKLGLIQRQIMILCKEIYFTCTAPLCYWVAIVLICIYHQFFLILLLHVSFLPPKDLEIFSFLFFFWIITATIEIVLCTYR